MVRFNPIAVLCVFILTIYARSSLRNMMDMYREINIDPITEMANAAGSVLGQFNRAWFWPTSEEVFDVDKATERLNHGGSHLASMPLTSDMMASLLRAVWV